MLHRNHGVPCCCPAPRLPRPPSAPPPTPICHAPPPVPNCAPPPTPPHPSPLRLPQPHVPYVTAVPHITVFDLAHCLPGVLVIASDGVWDHVSHADAVAAALDVPSRDVSPAPLPQGVFVPVPGEASPPAGLLPDTSGKPAVRGSGASGGAGGGSGRGSGGAAATTEDWSRLVELGSSRAGELTGNPSDRVLGVALGLVARQHGVHALAVRAAKSKRGLHDDMTVVCVDLQGYGKARLAASSS
jgi:hypothetical protein